MENPERCFFCCKNISEEKQNRIKDSFDSFNCDDVTLLNSDPKRTIDYILRISNYLKVPKSILDEDKVDATTLSITTCLECSEISKNLSDLCVQLESINLKISHYFNLLADQILEIPSEEDDDDNGNQINLSNFQKLVHEKCLFKVQQDNLENQSDLNNSPAVQNLSEDTDTTTNQSIILEEAAEDQIKQEVKIEEDPNDEELHSCPFCDYLVHGPYNLLHCHITAQHPEHLQTEELEAEEADAPKITSVSTYKPVTTCDQCHTFVGARVLQRHKRLFCKNRPTSPKSNPKIFIKKENKCKNCGKVLATRQSLRRHLRNLTCLQTEQSGKVNKERKSCPFCNFSVEGSYDLLHSHITQEHPGNLEGEEEISKISEKISKSSKNPNKVKCQQCHKTFSSIWNIRRHMITVHGGHGHRGTGSSMSSCDLCGTVTSTLGLEKHKRLFCRARKNAVPGSSLTKKKIFNKQFSNFKCKICGTGFASRGNLRRHLREVAACAEGNGDELNLKERFECSECNRQYSRLDYVKKHIEMECKTGLLIDHDSGRRLTLGEVAKEISKCEFCGLNVYTRNLGRHFNKRHGNGVVKRKGVGEGKKVFNCGGCGKRYNIRRSWTRHLQNSEKCRLANCNLNVDGNLEVEGEQEEEQETEVFLSIPEREETEEESDSLLMMMEDVLGPSEDPLQI